MPTITTERHGHYGSLRGHERVDSAKSLVIAARIIGNDYRKMHTFATTSDGPFVMTTARGDLTT